MEYSGLAAAPLFQTLTPNEVAELASVCEERCVAVGETLFKEGDAGDGLYVLQKGTVDILKSAPGGEPQRLATLTAPSVLGEMSLLSNAGLRSATAWVREAVTLVLLPSSRFHPLLKAGNLAAYKLTTEMAKVMAQRLSEVDEQLVRLLAHEKRAEELAQFQKVLARWSF